MTDSEKLDLLLFEMQEMNQKTDKLDIKVKEISSTLETEIRTNILRVAEKYGDLSRKLSEATRINAEIEMLAIRVSMLETEMRRLRQQLDQMAG